MQHVWIYGNLSAHCAQLEICHGHHDQLSHHLHALHWHEYQTLSLLIFWYEHWEIVRFRKKNGHRKCWKRSEGTRTNKVNFIAKGQWRGSCWSLIIVSPSPRVGLSQINNLCNMLTVCSFKQPNGYWHLNHYCIKIIFCGCMLCFCFTDSIQQCHIENQCRMPPIFRWMELVYLYTVH